MSKPKSDKNLSTKYDFFLKKKQIAKVPRLKESRFMRLEFLEIRLFEFHYNLSNLKTEVTGFSSRQTKYKTYLFYVNKPHKPPLNLLEFQ